MDRLRQDNLADMRKKGRARGGPAHPREKIGWAQANAIRELWAAGEKQKNLATRFGVAQQTVSMIVNNRRWKEPFDGN